MPRRHLRTRELSLHGHENTRLPVRLFRKRSGRRQRGRSWWVSRPEARGGLGGGAYLAARLDLPEPLSGPGGRNLVPVELQQIVGGGG
jgi:hypothetical protein